MILELSLINEIRNLSDMFLTLRNFDFKEDDVGSDHEDICRKLTIMPRFHLYINLQKSTINQDFSLVLKLS